MRYCSSCLNYTFGYFRKELETRVALNGPEFQDAVSKQVAKEEQRHEQRVKEFEEKINMLNKKYMDLEDEFRLALTIEGKRFKEVRLREHFISLKCLGL